MSHYKSHALEIYTLFTNEWMLQSRYNLWQIASMTASKHTCFMSHLSIKLYTRDAKDEPIILSKTLNKLKKILNISKLHNFVQILSKIETKISSFQIRKFAKHHYCNKVTYFWNNFIILIEKVKFFNLRFLTVKQMKWKEKLLW